MNESRFIFCLITFTALMLSDTAFAQHSPEHLFQAGIYAEEIKGDLHEALKFYQKIVQDFPDNRPVAAKAQLQIGLCYEKLGQKKAIAAYQKVLENYPDQREIVALARERLAQSKIRDQKFKIHPLTKYYFERLVIDITTSISYDGKYLAYTDWTTGSLMIKSLHGDDFEFRNADFGTLLPQSAIQNPQSRSSAIKNPKCIVEANFSRSPEYAYYPAWSRNGKYIAYSWYRGPYFIELRVVSVADGKIEVIYSDPKLIINPDDWSPDGKTIVCETLNFERDPDKHLVLVRIDSKELHDILPLYGSTRRMQFSPDGKYIVYNLQKDGSHRIYMLALEDFQPIEVPISATVNFAGFDTPVWSPDGKLLLCRSMNQFELWAVPMHDGKVIGKGYWVQSDLPNVLLRMKGINHANYSELNRRMNKKITPRHTRNTESSFAEEFSSSVLDPAWSVFEWKQPNVYDYSGFGRYSLTDHPGHLRYYSDSSMGPGYLQSYLPQFTGWYWRYPSLEISRPFYGDHWVLEAKVTYSLVDGANGRYFCLVIFFDSARDHETALTIARRKDGPQNGLSISLHDHGNSIVQSENCLSPKDTLGVTKFTYLYRIARADTAIQVELSDDDGKNYWQVLSGSLRPDLRGLPQVLALTGDSWFVPAGSYADWDYIRFRRLDR